MRRLSQKVKHALNSVSLTVTSHSVLLSATIDLVE